ncbi:MAG: hypothetical protein ACYDBH_21500 [Acidobacteriaceae bacterium]
MDGEKERLPVSIRPVGPAVPLLGDLGGTLRWYGGGLLVLDAKHHIVVRLLGLL